MHTLIGFKGFCLLHQIDNGHDQRIFLRVILTLVPFLEAGRALEYIKSTPPSRLLAFIIVFEALIKCISAFVLLLVPAEEPTGVFGRWQISL